MSAPTIRDVAKRAGVGIGTVSRVLNNSQQVSPDTRERVLDAIRVLGFRPNISARQLSQGARHRNIGVIYPFLSTPSSMERLRGMQLALANCDSHYNLVLYNVSQPEQFDSQLNLIVEQRLLDGVIVVALSLSEQQQTALREVGIHFVGISDRLLHNYPCIGHDNVAAGFLATAHLIDLGHTAIAFVGDEFPDPYGFTSGEDRYSGYAMALEQANIPVNPDYIMLGPHGEEAAITLTAELLTLPDIPTAIFATSDVQAIGCLHTIRSAGLRVPHDISVLGFDDIEISKYIGLSTVCQHLRDSGRLGMQLLLDLLNGQPLKPNVGLPEPEVITRGTTIRYKQ